MSFAAGDQPGHGRTSGRRTDGTVMNASNDPQRMAATTTPRARRARSGRPEPRRPEPRRPEPTSRAVRFAVAALVACATAGAVPSAASKVTDADLAGHPALAGQADPAAQLTDEQLRSLGFVRVRRGRFTIGSSSREPGRAESERQVQVTLSRDFWLQATEVTQAQFQDLMGRNPSFHTSCGGSCPVEEVSWLDAVAYTNALSARHGLPPCYDEAGVVIGGDTAYDCVGFRLPTEAEWEYAARAGSTGMRYGELDRIAWYRDNSRRNSREAGSLEPNAWGLQDMLGNVWEWTSDVFGEYPERRVTDPTGPSEGEVRVVRGGSWISYAEDVRVAIRGFAPPEFKDFFTGFRVARTVQR